MTELILLLQDAWEIGQWKEEAESGETVVAMTPEADWILSREKIPHHIPNDFYIERDLRTLAYETQPLVLALLDRIDARLCDQIPDFRRESFRPAWDHTHRFLCWITGTARLATHVLESIVARNRPREIRAGLQAPLDPVPQSLWWHESLYSLLLPRIAARSGARLSGWNRGTRLIQPLTAPSRFHPPTIRRHWRTYFRKPRGVLFYSPSYDLVPVESSMQDQGIPSFRWRVVTRGRPATGCWRIAQGVDDVRAYFENDPAYWSAIHGWGGEIRPILGGRLRIWWDRIAPYWETYRTTKNLLRSFRPWAILHSGTLSEYEVALAAAGRRLGIPCFTYQHGGWIGYLEQVTIDPIHLRAGDRYLVYGPAVAPRLGSVAPVPQTRIVPVGSARMESLAREGPARGAALRARLKLNPTKKVVLYVPHTCQGFNRYLSFADNADLLYWRLLTGALRVLGRHSEHEILLKPFAHPAFSMPVAEAAEVLAPNVRILPQDISLSDLLWVADAIAVDTGSTALLEAVSTNRPIVALFDHRICGLFPEAREPLARRVRLHETPEAFLADLEVFLSEGDFSLNDDPAFLHAYAIPPGEGTVAERAVHAILDEVRSRNGGFLPPPGLG